MTAAERQLDYNDLNEHREELKEQVKPLNKVIHDRRTELGLSQAEVARQLGIGSPEFIWMVEAGKRVMELNKIPRLADILQLDRRDLINLALFEKAPILAMSLFGSRPGAYTPRNRKPSKQAVTMTPAMETYHQKLYSLPGPQRETVLQLIDQFSMAGTPGGANAGRKRVNRAAVQE